MSQCGSGGEVQSARSQQGSVRAVVVWSGMGSDSGVAKPSFSKSRTVTTVYSKTQDALGSGGELKREETGRVTG